MSLVTIIATEKFLSVVTDGREMRNGEVVGESYPKCKQFSNVLITYAGVKQPAEIIISLLEKEGILERGNLAEIAGFVNVLFHTPELSSFTLLFAVGGIDPQGKISFYTIDSKHKKFTKNMPVNGKTSFAVLGNQEAANNLQKRLRINKGALSLAEAQRIQSELNGQISKRNIGVNNTLFKFSIKRS
ncbi:hypothetical protein [Paenibacillus wynnii]|uniref:Uncharacterized protein n=1 Tax=Paenibacillus wynnii TaxID=268407 RepID=A0A098M522_9BACL|nr:hypothetical protein [Paenibacillus wynnii]KGE16642.1 hypothetical protein PWYN_18215 [Paenibacillus wynnii]